MILGTDATETLEGNSLDNFIWTNGGNDSVFAGFGHDTIYLSNGTVFVDGSFGNDTVNYLSENEVVIVDLLEQNANRFGAAGDIFVNVEGIVGTNFGDTLRGNDEK